MSVTERELDNVVARFNEVAMHLDKGGGWARMDGGPPYPTDPVADLDEELRRVFDDDSDEEGDDRDDTEFEN